VCQGQLVPMFWRDVINSGTHIFFAHTSFKWHNLAANNAGVTVVIIGLSKASESEARLFVTADSGEATQAVTPNINAYLTAGADIYVEAQSKPAFDAPVMYWGNKPVDGGHLLMSLDEARAVRRDQPDAAPYL